METTRTSHNEIGVSVEHPADWSVNREQAMLAGLFNIAAAGNVRSETLRAFTEAEMEAVIQKM